MSNPHLTIRLTPDGFSFSVGIWMQYADNTLDAEAEWHHVELPAGPDYVTRLADALLSASDIDVEADTVHCEVNTTRVVALPAHLEADTQHAMWQMTLTPAERPETMVTQTVTLTDQTVTLAFGLDSEVAAFMRRTFGSVEYCHPLASLLTTAQRRVAGTCLVAGVTADALDLALFRNGQLELVNRYDVRQPDNRSYYVMNTWQQMGLDQLRDTLLVVGSGNEALQLRAAAHRFIKHIFA